MADIRVAIDRGGTFCDVVAQVEGREPIIFKLLSEDPANYRDAPTEAIRRVLEVVEDRKIPIGDKLDGSRIAACRIGTTVATNALLEHKGEKFAFVTTKGFADVCVIGDQSRPKLFDLNVRKPKALHAAVIEVNERVTIEDYDLNPSPVDRSVVASSQDPDLVTTPSGEIIRILKRIDPDQVRGQLQELRDQGFESLAICFMHAYVFPDHEDAVAALARDAGFKFVTTSAQTSPVVKLLNRSNSTCSEAYLYPIIRNYIENFESGFATLPQRVEFMCSDGGLKQAQKFKGNEALLSGPAGGVVGIARSCFDEVDGTPIIGFDMGVVGPKSAGAHPGPACYRKGGPLTVTDANLFLGRLVVSSFPSIFGENADQPLDRDVVVKKFEDITAEFNQQTSQKLTAEEVALGFLNVANEAMSRPIRNITEARGFAPERHNLTGREEDIDSQVVVAALRIRHFPAELQHESYEPYAGKFSMEGLGHIRERLKGLKQQVSAELLSQGAEADSITYDESLVLRYFGTDTTITISKPEDEDYGSAFKAHHLREFAFTLNRNIVIDSIKVRGTGSASAVVRDESPFKELDALAAGSHDTLQAEEIQSIYVSGGWRDVAVFRLEKVSKGSVLEGPALVIDKTQTIFVEPQFKGYILTNHVVLEKVQSEPSSSTLNSAMTISADSINPIQLSVFAHRFMSIAEQMGNTLQRTSISTSIKERLDFSCAIFSPDGKLVANAPHIPIHLGSMQFAIQYQHRLWEGKLTPGDVLLTNHPQCGGTHLPDLTVVSPVFFADRIVFYVASRGHHTDIGGKGITSMMPESKELWEEGINIKSMKIVSGGVFLEDDVRAAFARAGEFPGCSATRRIADNLSDLKAQISSNQRGITLLDKLCNEFGLSVVHTYMHGIQANAEVAVRDFFKRVAKQTQHPLEATDYFDDGTAIRVRITLDAETGSAVYDFAGTGPQTWGNYNCPVSITHSAIIYTVRCLVDADIPLNEGCLAPVSIKIPAGSILNPTPAVAVCGSTLASQRVVDTILRAFGRCAASQGCANSFGWGMGGRDPTDPTKIIPGWNYGESLGGGVGAGPGWHGESATNVHSTNTRNTDPEVIEKRTAVLVKRYGVRRGSGGVGQFRGGDGVVREIEARVPLKFSILSDRRVYRPYGMAGGGPGEAGRNYVYKFNDEGTLERINIGGKAVVSLNIGEVMQINTPGGGGWGRPDDNEKVNRDCNEEQEQLN
ncbi:hydantoinase b oxoprolinase [Apiospora arundinis]